MFAKRERIPRDTLAAFRGRGTRSAFFAVKLARNDANRNRFAVIVSKKVDRRAVRRHNLKRRASEILKRAPMTGGDIVLTILPPASSLTKENFAGELEELLIKAFRDSSRSSE